MKRLLITVLIVMFSFCGLYAQQVTGLIDMSNVSENYLNITFGPAYITADTKAPIYSNININNRNLSIGFRKRFSNNFGYKAELSFSNFTGKDDSTEINRHFSFVSNVMQFNLQGEYHIKIGRKYYYRPTPNSIYGFLGGGMLISNVKLKTDNVQRGIKEPLKKPNDFAPGILFGFGYEYDFNNGFYIGAQYYRNMPFSDYIDGFKTYIFTEIPSTTTNGLPTYIKKASANDFFDGISITFSYLLGQEYLKRH